MVEFVRMSLDREWFFVKMSSFCLSSLFRRLSDVAKFHFNNFLPVSEGVFQTDERWKRVHVKQATQHRCWISMSASSLAVEFSGKRVSKQDSSKHTKGTHRE